MARGFAGGIFWGGVIVVAGLVALSQLAPIPVVEPGKPAANTDAAPSAAAPAEPKVAEAALPGTAPADTSPAASSPAPASSAAPVEPAPETAAPPPSAQPGPAPAEPAAPEAAAPATQQPAPAGPSAAETPAEPASTPEVTSRAMPTETPAAETPAVAPLTAEPDPAVLAPLPPLPEAPAAAEAAPSLSALDQALAAPEDPAPPGTLGVTEAPAAKPEPAPGPDGFQPSGLAEPSRLPQISEEPDPGLAPEPLPQLAPPAASADAPTPPAEPPLPAPPLPALVKPDASGLPGTPAQTLGTAPVLEAKPAGTLPEGDPKVAVNELPQIGKTAPVADPQVSDDRPLVKFARPFAGAEGKPLFSILLRDIGDKGLPRDQLAQLPFPVSVVIDPLAPDAKAAAEAWRAAGQEVVMLATGLPPGAKAEDVAQSFQAMGAILPEAVAVLDPAEAGFQDDRTLAGLVLTEVASEGRGILTWDRGLNAADQIARRDGIPGAQVYRQLDGAGESQPVMRRYLDRAAFKAGQEGSVVVIGDTAPDTIEALLAWALEGKGASVALAPVSAVLLGLK